jgi:hypothetical protein
MGTARQPRHLPVEKPADSVPAMSRASQNPTEFVFSPEIAITETLFPGAHPRKRM